MMLHIKYNFVLLIGASFLLITSLVAAEDHGHEGHDHGLGHEEVNEQKINTDDGMHEGHNHENHAEHEHGEEETNEEHANHGHEEHSGHSDEVTLSEEAIKLYKLRIETVRRQKLIRKISAPVRVTYNTEAMAHVGTSVSGRVKDIRYRIGDHVQKGSVLLVVNSPELGRLQSEYLQKRIEVQVAEISMEVATIGYKRAKKLLDGNGISKAQFLEAEGKFKVTEGGLLTAKSTVQDLENRLQIFGISQEQIAGLINTEKIDSVYKILAPISGEIIAREATLGEVVKPDDHALMIIADLSTLWVIASVPEIKTPFVKVGAPAYFKTEAIGRETLTGKVAYIAPALDERTRTGQVRIEVPNKERVLRPGMFGTAMINETTDHMESIPDVLSVPESAVFTVEGGPAVFVPSKVEKNTFEKRAITIGPVISGNVTVLSGLEEGELYVEKGGFILKAELGKEGVAHEH